MMSWIDGGAGGAIDPGNGTPAGDIGPAGIPCGGGIAGAALGGIGIGGAADGPLGGILSGGIGNGALCAAATFPIGIEG